VARRDVRRSLIRWAKAQWRYFRIALSLFWRSLLVVLLLLASGTLIFKRYLNIGGGAAPDWVEALWNAFGLLAAQPGYPMTAAWPVRLAYFALPVGGLLVVAQSIVRFSLLLLDKRANEKEWMQAMAATARDHVILCGLGSVGFRVLEELAALGQEVVAIEKNPQGAYLGRARDLKSTILIDDATVEAVLLRAGLAEARAVIAATDNDIVNLEIALDARRMKPGVRVVMRIFDQKTALKIREAFGIETLSSATLAAPTFALSALGPDILGSVRIGEGLYVTAEIAIARGSPWDGLLVKEICGRFRVAAVAHRGADGRVEVSPSPKTPLRGGERLVLSGLLEAISAARREAGNGR
jgi:voltage-gated potassium channel